MNKLKKKASQLHRRHVAVRSKVSGTADRPRMCVTRSNNNLYVQLIDDVANRTLLGISSLGSDFKKSKKSGANKEGATELGALVGKKCMDMGITSVVFDRGGHVYHGRIKALAEAARSAGLKF